MVPDGCSSVSCEIAYGPNDPWPPSREEMTARAEADLRKAGVLRPDDQIVFSETIPIKYGYVIFDADRRAAVKTIHAYLEAHGIRPCGRYGEWAYLWSDEAILSGRKAAEQVMRGR
jgi:protoporphyrinogen oxidase